MRHRKQREAKTARNSNRLLLTGRNLVKTQRRQAAEPFREPQPSELAARLDRLADVRRSAVERGKILVSNPEYPSAKVMRGVARVLARNWRR
jgi:hypothetical protein